VGQPKKGRSEKSGFFCAYTSSIN